MKKEEEIARALEFLGELYKMQLSTMGQVQQRRDFVLGLVLGLFYGIIGNVVISHYYGLFESLTVGKYDALFWANLIFLVLSFVIIIFVSKRWYNQLEKLETAGESVKKNIETLEKMYDTIKKYATTKKEKT